MLEQNDELRAQDEAAELRRLSGRKEQKVSHSGVNDIQHITAIVLRISP